MALLPVPAPRPLLPRAISPLDQPVRELVVALAEHGRLEAAAVAAAVRPGAASASR